MLRGPASPVAAQPQPPPLQSGTFHDRYVSTATGFRGLQRLMTELHVSQQQHQQLQQRASGLPRPQQRWMPQGESVTVHQQMRPQFRGKVVFRLECGDCGVVVCDRGMRAILLADTAVELFSTDHPPNGVQMVNEDYVTKNCYCRIRDVACLHCGNIVGYHVTQPCKDCLSSCNNGHFWMFHLNHVQSSERIDSSNGNRLFWARLPRVEKENETRLVGPGR
ncbi:FAM72 protein-domain-containing protein [Zopfochytrium polystomum]|nr:FAM72 protein-domain-containing protein [Zopfochytrium polystomum]